MLKCHEIMLEYIRKGMMKCLAGFVTCFSEARVGRGCKWVAWPLGMSNVLLVLATSETLGIKPGLNVFDVFVGFLGVWSEIGLIAPYQRASKSKKLFKLVCMVSSY